LSPENPATPVPASTEKLPIVSILKTWFLAFADKMMLPTGSMVTDPGCPRSRESCRSVWTAAYDRSDDPSLSENGAN